MDIQTILVATAIVLLLVLLFRKPENRVEQELRNERDRVASELEAERNAAQSRTTEAARLHERVVGLARLEAEHAGLKEDLRREQALSAQRQAELSASVNQGEQVVLRAAKAERQLDELRIEVDALRRSHAEAVANLRHSERANAEMKEFLATAQERLSGAFAELAGKTFEERTQKAAQQSNRDLETLLKPFADQLTGFRNRVDTLYGEEAKERATLIGVVNELKTLNQDIAGRAHELTRALKGNSKVRGDWGELMLESVLQGSGLVEGAHYQRQKSSNDDEGQRLQPDIVVCLPDDRRIVVDSKVNLVAWQEAMNADSPEQQQDALRRHSVALRQHVKDLGDKNYPKAIGSNALEITIAFVPIEGALSAALGFDGALQAYAFDRKIVFASPNTLMALLRVVDRLWSRDKIQREAAEIGKVGGLVLDSLMNFLSDFDNVGRQLDDAKTAFNSARGKLSDSRTAVIARARRLVELGAKGNKAITEELKGDGDTPNDSIGGGLLGVDGDESPASAAAPDTR